MGRQSLKERARRKGPTPAKITQARSAAVEQMNSKLKRKFNQIERQVNDLRAENLRYYHKIGAICEDIRENPDEYVGHDGTPGLKLVENALSTQARTLRKAATFAQTYDEDGLQELIDLYHTETNFQLHWGHVSYLLTLDTPEKRRTWAIKAVENMWDPPTLHEKIKKNSNRGGGHGRKHEMPKTVPAQVRQILTLCRQWAGKQETVWAGDEDANVFSNVLNHPPDEMTEDLRDDLVEVKELMAKIAEGAAANGETVDRVLEHVNGCLATRAEREAAEQGSGKSARSIDLDGDGTGQRRSRRRRAG